VAREQAECETQVLQTRVKRRFGRHRFGDSLLPGEIQQKPALSVQQVGKLLDQAGELLMLVVRMHGGPLPAGSTRAGTLTATQPWGASVPEQADYIG